MRRQLNRWIVLYVCLTKFTPDMLYEATDVAQWLGMPDQHRLMRYYLNRLTREGWLVRIVWGKRTFFGLRLLERLKSVADDFILTWEGGGRFRLGP